MERPAQPGQLGPSGSQPFSLELLAEIATGPTARVELCRIRAPKEVAGKLAAVKRLHPHIAEDPQFYSMFVDEVWMTAALDHPNITRVVGWGTDAEGTYLAVELIQGVSLARLMKTVFETREAFSERMVVYLGAQICAGLSAAHGLRAPSGEHLNLVHRDLTPGNVLIGFDGRVLIADFGLAKAKQRVTKTLTGLLKGHPHYMAPEQATERPIDGRSDLFSLGVVLFELFTGRHPWDGTTEIEIFQNMATSPPAGIASLRPKLDPELVAVVEKLLAKDPAERFRSADEVRDRFRYWLDAHGYKDDNAEAVARFVRRNAMRQMRWFERAIAGDFVAEAARAKSRLLGARARTADKEPSRMRAPQGGETAVTSKPPMSSAQRAAVLREAPSARRRAAARRLADDVTDVSDFGAKVSGSPLEERQSNETPDWAEEVPTVVKPNTAHPLRGGAGRGAPPRGPAPAPEMGALPSFIDDDTGDHRTTAVKPQVMLATYAKQAEERGAGGREPGKYGQLGTVVDLPKLEDPDTADSGEVPTSPLQRRPRLPEGVPLKKLPPPPAARREATAASFVGPRGGAPRTEAELAAEADRLASLASRLRAESEEAAKVAAHRAVLAQLAFEASALASEAMRALPTHGLAHALSVGAEAHRLALSIARGEASTSTSPDSGEVSEPSIPSAAPTPVMPRRDPGPPAPRDRDELPKAPSVPPPAPPGPPVPSFPPPVPMALPPAGERPSYAPSDPRREPTVPSRAFVGELPRSEEFFAGEVFGVRVPVALAAALLIAVAMVVLVWIIVS
ncbi:MAG: serine/threonine protein kinase [Polyangiaceae bacterium]|jgi:hypothetical protein|nr:serine/threonine protein kinase [Polyangiaceae bacterium]